MSEEEIKNPEEDFIKNICDHKEGNFKKIEYDKSIHREVVLKNLIKHLSGYFANKNSYESNCFLLDGIWGSGKSWTIDVFEKYIEMRKSANLGGEDLFGEYISNSEKFDKTTFYKFSAWHYLDEKELFYDLWKNLNSNLFDWIAKNGGNIFLGDDSKINRDDVQKWIDFYKSTRFLGEGMVNFIKNKAIDASGIGQIPILGMLAKKTTNTQFPKLESKSMQEEIDNLLKYSDRMTRLNIKDPIIVIIEDLDRIHENKLWRILSMLSLFDKQKNLLFICVGSSKYLIEILNKKYHVKGEGENFLTKFFAKEFALPETNYVDLLVKKLTPRLFTTNNAQLGDKHQLETNDDQRTIIKLLKTFVVIHSYRDYKIKYLEPLKEKFSLEENLTISSESPDQINQFYAEIIKIHLKNNHPIINNEFKKNKPEIGIQRCLNNDFIKYGSSLLDSSNEDLGTLALYFYYLGSNYSNKNPDFLKEIESFIQIYDSNRDLLFLIKKHLF
jgi:hypothetical protein